MSKIIFAYWNLRGRGEIARMMFEYAGVKYEDKRYNIDISADGQINTPGWTKEKETLGLAFPNLPYIIDGEVRLSESWAIYRYLGRKFGIFPKTEKGMFEADMIAGVVADLQLSIGTAAYSPNIKDLLAKTKESLTPKFQQLDKFLTGRKFVAEQRVTYVDFALYEILDGARLLFPDIFDSYSNIRAFLSSFASLKNIDSYFKSSRYSKFPIYAPMAAWGGKDHDDRSW